MLQEARAQEDFSGELIQTVIANPVEILIFVGIVAGSLAIGFLVKNLLVRYLKKSTSKTQTKVGDMIINAIRTPLPIWFLIAGARLAPIPVPASIESYIDKGLDIALSISIIFVVANIAAGIITHYGRQFSAGEQVSTIGRNLVKLAVFALGIVLIMGNQGIEITPLIASLGIGALAIGLALQSTLANIFSGFYLLADKPVRVGDYIQIEGGVEGWVEDIGWRSTKIRTLGDRAIVIIPNQKLAESVITNLYRPNTTFPVMIEIGVSYNDDPEKVERVLMEIGKEMQDKHEEVVKDKGPVVFFIPGFGDFSLGFRLIVFVKEFTQNFRIQSDIRKLIYKRFQAEGIEIPFPIRTVYLKSADEKAQTRMVSATKGAQTSKIMEGKERSSVDVEGAPEGF